MMMMEQKCPGPPKQRQQLLLLQRLAPPSDAPASTKPPCKPPSGKIAVALSAGLLCLLGGVWYCSHTILLPHATDLSDTVYPRCHSIVDDIINGEVSMHEIYDLGLPKLVQGLRICAEVNYPGAEELLVVFRRR